MKIVKENKDELNAVLRMTVEKEDYEPKVDKKLREHRKTASMKGFRAGKVPLGLIKKMYGKQVLAEEVNTAISQNLYKYIQDEKLNLLGEPMSSETEQKPVDFDSQTDFEFVFDIALAPEIDIKFDKTKKYTFYKINADEELVDEQVNRYAYQFGSQKNTEIVADEDLVYCEISEIDEDGNVVEGGLSVERTPISVKTIKDEEIKKQFIGANLSEVLNLDVTKAFENDADMAALFAVEQKDLDEKVKSKKFNFTVKEIMHFEKAEINQDLFDKAFGEGVVKSEEEFRTKVKEQLENQFKQDSEYRFQIDTRKKLIEDTKLPLPDEFLKRWVKKSDEKLTDEVIEKEYDALADNIRWDLIRNKVMEEQEIKVEEEDLKSGAIEMAKAQFAQYGMANLPNEQYEPYAQQILQNENQKKRIFEISGDKKIFQYIQAAVTLNEKEVSADEFKKLYEEEK